MLPHLILAAIILAIAWRLAGAILGD